MIRLRLTFLVPAAVVAAQAAAQIPVHRISEVAPAVIGRALCGIGDFDGDAVEDLVVGGTQVRVYSGATGGLLAMIPVAAPGPDGVTGPGDVNGDGTPDIAFGIAGSAVRLVAGATLATLWNAGPPAAAGTVRWAYPGEDLAHSIGRRIARPRHGLRCRNRKFLPEQGPLPSPGSLALHENVRGDVTGISARTSWDALTSQQGAVKSRG